MGTVKRVWHRIIMHKVRSIIMLVAAGGIIRRLVPSATPVQPITQADLYTVHTGTIQNTMKVTGKTSLINQQSLTFAQVGKVTKVLVKEGDSVKAGQLLAEIDKKDIMLNIAQQRISLSNAQLQYDKLLSTSQSNSIQQQSNLDDAQRKLLAAQQNLTNLTAERDRKIQDQQTQIDNLQQSNGSSNGSDQIYTKTAASAATDAISTLSQINDAVASFDTILHTHNQSDQSLTYLGARDPSTLSASQLDLQKLTNALNSFTQAYNVFVSSPKTIDVITTLQNANKDIDDIFAQTTQDMLMMINASIADDTYLSASTISSYRSTISSLNTKAISAVSSIASSIISAQGSVSDITSAQHQLTQLQQDYAVKIQQAKDTIASDEAALALAQSATQNTVDGINANDLALQKNSVANASVSLQKLQNQLKDYELRAVFDGTVSDVGFVVGDTPSTNKSTTDKAITISNPDLYEIDMMIDQIDIVKIHEGQEVRYTFDAYPGKIFTGTISSVVSTPVIDQGVTSFTVKVIGQKGSDPIYDQMSVNVDIILDIKQDVLVVPTAAISGSGVNQTVQLYENGSLQRAPVREGISDGKQTEITEGLFPGDTILLRRYTTQKAAAGGFSLFGGGGAVRAAGGGGAARAGGGFGGGGARPAGQ